MTNLANNNAAELIRKQIANLQEVLAILEAKPAVTPPAKAPVAQTTTKSPTTKNDPVDYKSRIDVLKSENDYILNTSRIGTPRLIKHILNIIELYYTARCGMAMYSRSDEEHRVLVGNSRILINLLKSQEKRIQAALKYTRWNGVPDRYVDVYVAERRRAKRLINKNSEVYVNADINPIDILTDIATTLNKA